MISSGVPFVYIEDEKYDGEEQSRREHPYILQVLQSAVFFVDETARFMWRHTQSLISALQIMKIYLLFLRNRTRNFE